MVSAEGLRRCNRRTRDMLRDFPARSPQFLQLFGSEPDALAEAARLVAAETVFSGIDINMGCPVPKVMRSGAGAALLGDLRRMAGLIRAVRAACPLPLTVKVRLGICRVNVLDSVRVIEAEGGDAVAVHFRLKTDGYHQPADWSLAAEIKSRLRIPLIGNGDILSVSDAWSRLETVDAVMIGRGGLANPFLFSEIAGQSVGAERWRWLAGRLCQLLEVHYPARSWLSKLKAFVRYLNFAGRVTRSQKKAIFLATEYAEAREKFLELVSRVEV